MTLQARSGLPAPAGSPPNVTTPMQNLLGINNFDEVAGFWTDNNGHEHGFVVQIDTQSLSSSTFIEIPPTTFAGAVARPRPATSLTTTWCVAFGRMPMATITASLAFWVKGSFPL